jgi:hypothetical protein
MWHGGLHFRLPNPHFLDTSMPAFVDLYAGSSHSRSVNMLVGKLHVGAIDKGGPNYINSMPNAREDDHPEIDFPVFSVSIFHKEVEAVRMKYSNRELTTYTDDKSDLPLVFYMG